MKLNKVHYDFKNDYLRSETKIEQFLHYKNKPNRIDLDSIKEVVEIYCEANEFLNGGNIVTENCKVYRIEKNGYIYTGETMNSGLLTLKKALQLSPNYKENCKKFGISGSFSKNIDKFIANLHHFQIGVKIELLNKFLELTHTIGNFILVPEGFNTGRNLLTSDYWSLALYNIYLWYETKNDEYLHRFLAKRNPNVVTYTKIWLDYFENWQNFVEKNYLQPFVVYENGTPTQPIPFWEEHFNRYEKFHNKKLTKTLAIEPNNIDEVNEFLEKVNTAIVARGDLIKNALIKRKS